MISIKDVARKAGVSASTVSLVLNQSDKVKPETAERVRCIIDELHYIPNQAARSLVTKEKKVISLIRISNSDIPQADADLFDVSVDTLIMDMLPGVQRVLAQHGYSILVDFFVPLDMPIDQIAVFDKTKIDGAIFVGGMVPEETVNQIRESGIPSVFAFGRYEGMDYIDTDPAQGIFQAAQELIDYGHRDIAFINGSLYSRTSELKMDGFCRALDDNGLRLRPDWVINADFIGRAGYDAMETLWNRGVRPTAVICSCDNSAMGVYRFLHEQGMKCPEDISIVGYESGMLSMHCVPPMTSVYTSKQEIGEETARMLIERIRKPKGSPVQNIISPKLSRRKSVMFPKEQTGK